MNRQCSYIKAGGEQCRGLATASHGLCWSHAPENAEQRRRSTSKAGRAKADMEVRALKEELKAVIADVRSGELDRSDAAVMIQAYRALKEYIQLERDVSVIPELADRLEALKNERRRAG